MSQPAAARDGRSSPDPLPGQPAPTPNSSRANCTGTPSAAPSPPASEGVDIPQTSTVSVMTVRTSIAPAPVDFLPAIASHQGHLVTSSSAHVGYLPTSGVPDSSAFPTATTVDSHNLVAMRGYAGLPPLVPLRPLARRSDQANDQPRRVAQAEVLPRRLTHTTGQSQSSMANLGKATYLSCHFLRRSLSFDVPLKQFNPHRLANCTISVSLYCSHCVQCRYAQCCPR